MNRAVFLDRDGTITFAPVIDGKPGAPATVEEMRILDGVPAALASLRAAGYLLICVTNQPDVSRGRQTLAVVEAMHAKLLAELPLDQIYTCYHDDADNCDCRKPKPGMLLQGAREHDIDLSRSFMVGDRWRDIEAGINAGVHTAFIDYAYPEKQPATCDVRVKSFAEAARWILTSAQQ
ncbi:MAG TPA: HAD family hydrolase [Kofleriaceae bacterium]|jgi:D-glycero-D-manno-heptose 1,7-bisphosphate phosphatase